MNDCPCGGNCACGYLVSPVLVSRYGNQAAWAYCMSEASARFGYIQANSVDDPENEEAILAGQVKGSGLLGRARRCWNFTMPSRRSKPPSWRW